MLMADASDEGIFESTGKNLTAHRHGDLRCWWPFRNLTESIISFHDVEIPPLHLQLEERLYWVSESVFQRDVDKYADLPLSK